MERQDGFNVGGEQPKMHSTTITSIFCLGTFSTALVVSSVQHCQFQENDPPPYFNPTQPKYDIPKPGALPNITKLNKNVLVDRLLANSPLTLTRQGLEGSSKEKLVEMATNLGIATTETKEAMIKGYVGQAKGTKQMAWERGFMDPTKLSEYYHKPEKDEAEEEDFSLVKILSRCPDFLNEETQMEHVMKKLGVEVEMSPKCHPELAGSGVEYCWGKSKKYYRAERSGRHGQTVKINEEDFFAMVQSSLRGGPDVADGEDPSLSPPLQMTQVLRFIRKAHFYKMGYFALREGSDTNSGLSLKAIEAKIKALQDTTYKQHRGVKDSELNE